MKRRSMRLAMASALALGLSAFAVSAQAGMDDTMKHDMAGHADNMKDQKSDMMMKKHDMTHDSMKTDKMKKSDGMMHDDMKSDHMKSDGMKHDDKMPNDPM